MSYVLWVIPDRGGGWTERATATTLAEVEAKRKRLYDDLGDVSVRALPKGEHPSNGGYDVTDPRRATPDTPPAGPEDRTEGCAKTPTDGPTPSGPETPTPSTRSTGSSTT